MARKAKSCFHLGLSSRPLDHTPCIFAVVSPPRNSNRSSAPALRDAEEGARNGFTASKARFYRLLETSITGSHPAVLRFSICLTSTVAFRSPWPDTWCIRSPIRANWLPCAVAKFVINSVRTNLASRRSAASRSFIDTGTGGSPYLYSLSLSNGTQHTSTETVGSALWRQQGGT